MTHKPVVFVIVEDPTVREYLINCLETEGITFQNFASRAEFDAEPLKSAPCCIIQHLHLPETDNAPAKSTVLSRQFSAPVVCLVRQGDLPLAIFYMKCGAFDVLEVPLEKAKLIESIRLAVAESVTRKEVEALKKLKVERLARLSSRERQVLELICKGMPSKLIARRLDISINTVSNHRARLLAKLDAESTAELMRMVIIEQELGFAMARVSETG